MSSCFCSSNVFIMCLACNSLTLVSALVPCSTSVLKSTLQPVNLTLHFTFSENSLNLKSGYLHKTAIKSLLQSCLCLFSACECSPGIHKYICGCVQGCISRQLKLRNIQNLSLCLQNTALPRGGLHEQRSMVGSQFLFVEGMNTLPEFCPCGCAALLFHPEGSYGSLGHVHSIMHTAQETLKNHRCLPQNLPHLAS